MSESYTDTLVTYGFNGSSVQVSIDPRGIVYTQADLDAAIQAFADSLNSSGNGPTILRVARWSQASGVSDWSYTPS